MIMKSSRTKVLYITGWGRSGSTVLSMLLGQLEHFFLTGEMNQIWENGLIKNELCGCRSRFSACETWISILRAAYGDVASIVPQKMVHYLAKYIRTKDVPKLILSKNRSFPQELIQNLDQLYTAVQKTTNSHVIVDSSKHPVYGQLLECLPSIDVYILHLVRDPRAVAYSWQRKKKVNIDDARMFRTKSPQTSSIKWLAWNIGIHSLKHRMNGRYMRIRYEDLISQPRATLTQILEFVDEEDLSLSFLNEDRVDIGLNHAIAGNPVRFQQGELVLKADMEWESKMKFIDRVITVLITWPLLGKYGYM
jgi:hypothetical protein